MNPRVCVIGAGCSGLTAIKNLIQAGIKDIVCFEKNDQIGGNWIFTAGESHSSVCETTHIISSKKMSEYLDFPMPEDYPDYPSHKQVLDYFRNYARHFDLEKYVQFNTEVKSAQKLDGEKWSIEIQDGSRHEFDFLFVANGHHSVPRLPELPGEFNGEYLHSHSYKTNDAFRGKRVLIIGAGNSGCDCAVEISRVAQLVAVSMRRPYYIIPKFFMGKPTDTFNGPMSKFPKILREPLQQFSLWLQVGNYQDYGLEKPYYPATRCHPILNSELLYKIRHGKVHTRKGIDSINKNMVTFSDGKKEEFDVIIAATGYKISFPFFKSSFINFEDSDRIELFLRMVHPDHPTLFFIGLVQPQGCVWPLSDLQSKYSANVVAGRTKLPSNIEVLARKEADHISSEFIASKRHSLEVHYQPFFDKIKKYIPADAPDWTG